MVIDNVLIQMSYAEDQYLRLRGWRPAVYNKIRVWIREGDETTNPARQIYTHATALYKQRKEDAEIWEKMDEIAADLLPTKYGKAPSAPTE